MSSTTPNSGNISSRPFPYPLAIVHSVSCNSSDTSSRFPHMLPTPVAFADSMTALGISDDDAVVVYDGRPLPRATWKVEADFFLLHELL